MTPQEAIAKKFWEDVNGKGQMTPQEAIAKKFWEDVNGKGQEK